MPSSEQSSPPPGGFPGAEAWASLSPERQPSRDWCQFRHAEQGEFLHDLAKRARFPVELGQIGASVEGRALWTLRFGKGPVPVLAWARQHGNEFHCTAGLSMALEHLLADAASPVAAAVHAALDILVLPMVNPDGVARFTRQNAQGIDINRDAIAAASPEGRAIIAARDRHKPRYCFNLHDMGPRKTNAGGDLVALAFQAGPFEPADTDNETRLRAKAIIARMADACREHAPVNLAKYTADYMHRAFGDSMMRWGVSSILIESGGWYADRGGEAFVQRLDALALLSGLHAIAVGADSEPQGGGYDAIPFDSGPMLADVLLSGGRIMNGSSRPCFRADLSVNALRPWRRVADQPAPFGAIEGLGDLEDRRAKRRLDLAGGILVPGGVAICPTAQFADGVPSRDEATPYLLAGMTGLVCGFGPFSNDEQSTTWLSEARRQPPPIHLVALERVDAIEDIRRRHGMTAFAGFLVEALGVTARLVVDLLHLFHPATHSALAEADEETPLRLDLMYCGAPDARQTRLALLLSPATRRESSECIATGDDELRRFAGEFLRHPDQILVAFDADDVPAGVPPITACRTGLSRGRSPKPDMLSRLAGPGADEGAVASAVNLATYQACRAFRTPGAGLLRVGHRADIVALPPAFVERPGAACTPTLVMLNGVVVAEGGRLADGAPRGTWQLAGGG